MTDALTLALLCQQSYNELPTVGSKDGSCRAHFYGDVLIFEGTSDFESLLADAEVETVNTVFGLIHSGFWDSLDEISSALMARTTPTGIGGHSLGAAHAMLYSSLLARSGHIIPTYCFEPPRVSADNVLRDFVDASRIPVYACRNGNDIITQVPSWMTFPFALDRIGTPTFPFDNIDDHAISSVIVALQNM